MFRHQPHVRVCPPSVQVNSFFFQMNTTCKSIFLFGTCSRTFDGSCNNLNEGKTNLGAAHEPMTRLLPVQYSDNKHAPRTSSIANTQLPSARSMSIQMTDWSSYIKDAQDSPINSLLFMQMGQFLDHDLVHTPAHSSKKYESYIKFNCHIFYLLLTANFCLLAGKDVSCSCSTQTDHVCFPMKLEDAHPLGECHPFTRSLMSFDRNCNLSKWQSSCKTIL